MAVFLAFFKADCSPQRIPAHFQSSSVAVILSGHSGNRIGIRPGTHGVVPPKNSIRTPRLTRLGPRTTVIESHVSTFKRNLLIAWGRYRQDFLGECMKSRLVEKKLVIGFMGF